MYAEKTNGTARSRPVACWLDRHGLFFLVEHGAVHTQLLGLTVLEVLDCYLREQGVAQHVLLLLVVVANLLAVLIQFGRDVVGRTMGNDLVVADALFANFFVDSLVTIL